MDHQHSSQVVLLCHLKSSMYCDNCHVQPGTACGKHLLDKSKEHKIVFLKCEDLRLNIKNIYQKYTNIVVNNATFLFVHIVFAPGNAKTIR